MNTWEPEDEKLREEANELLKEYRILNTRTVIQNFPRVPNFSSEYWFMHTPTQKFCLEGIAKTFLKKVPEHLIVEFVEIYRGYEIGTLEITIRHRAIMGAYRLGYCTDESFFKMNEIAGESSYLKKVLEIDNIEKWFKDIDKETVLFRFLYNKELSDSNAMKKVVFMQKRESAIRKRALKISRIFERLREINIALSFKEGDEVTYCPQLGMTVSSGIIKGRTEAYFIIEDIPFGGEKRVKFTGIQMKDAQTDLGRRIRAIQDIYGNAQQYQMNPEAYRKEYCQNLI